jgi:iron complex outermembrane receptor protein
MSNYNTFVAGITYEEMKQYDVRSQRNFLDLPFPCAYCGIPLPRVVDLSDIQNYNRPAKRNFKAFFIENIWDITDDIRLTTGVRYDDYSDFGDEVSPRAGLTWEFTDGYDLKLLYGHAFRAPNFSELYYGSGVGNPDLDPEEVDTYQVSLGAQLASTLNSRVTWFQNRIKDSIFPDITIGSTQFANQGTIRTEGLEAEMKYDLGRGSYLA